MGWIRLRSKNRQPSCTRFRFNGENLALRNQIAPNNFGSLTKKTVEEPILNLGNLICLFLALLGLGAVIEIKQVEAKAARAAVEAHKQGYVSIEVFHKRLMQGR